VNIGLRGITLLQDAYLESCGAILSSVGVHGRGSLSHNDKSTLDNIEPWSDRLEGSH
jgi:hypothetical protein